VKRSALIDLGIFCYMFSWMILAWGTFQAVGGSPWVVAGALTSGLVSLMYLAGQKIAYLRIGERVEVQTKDDKRPKHERKNR